MTINQSFSQTISVPESATLVINQRSAEMASRGELVFKFGFSQSPFPPPACAVAALQAAASRKEYTHVQGLLPLREAIRSFQRAKIGIEISTENIFVAPGSKILVWSLLTCWKEADVLLPSPTWVTYEPQARLIGHNVIHLPTTGENRWRLTAAQLDQALSSRANKSRPSVLILAYPGNPDGLSYTESELQALANVARKHSLVIISDEIYSLLKFDGTHTSIAKLLPENTIVTTGLSKWAGAGGWRLGVAMLPNSIPSQFRQTLIGIASETYSCAPVPVQMAAIEAFSLSPEIDSYLKHVRRVLRTLSDYCFDKLTAAGFEITKPSGGLHMFIQFPSLPKGMETSSQLCEHILNKTGVALLPGSVFGVDPAIPVAKLSFVDIDGPLVLEKAKQVSLSEELPVSFVSEFCPKIVQGVSRLADYAQENCSAT